MGANTVKKKVLIMAGYYFPSIKGGGPIQSIKNLVENFSHQIDFYLVAADRDLGDNKSFNNITIDQWTKVGNANVYYTNPSLLTWKRVAEIIKNVEYDVLYLNSFFSYKDSIVPVLLEKFKKIPKKPIIIAPRGQFSEGALNLKNRKKFFYLKLSKMLGLYNNVIWHATTEIEKKDIERIYGENIKIKIANNLTANYNKLNYKKDIIKIPGKLKIVFVSRIHPKKNLKGALKILKSIRGEIEFNIYGPLEDSSYWSECKNIIKTLPENVSVIYKGIVAQKDIINIFNANHVFLFPTLGENYGHVISEALIGGCPVIISDQTPWRNLEKLKVGNDISLKKEKDFINALQYYVDIDEVVYKELSLNAFNYARTVSNNENDILNTYELFN